jgi:hypothetical protein
MRLKEGEFVSTLAPVVESDEADSVEEPTEISPEA